MLVSSLESRAPDNFTVLGSHFILFQVYFEASNATAIYKLVYECATYSSALLGRCSTLLELTVCGDSRHAMLQAQAWKGGKEEHLIIASHLEDIGLETSFYTIEIFSLGHTNSDTIKVLKSIYIM